MSSHNRRQSGLWQKNSEGVYEQSPLPSAKIAVSGAYLPESSPPSGPYSYYQPPQQEKRTFSEHITPEKMVTTANRPPLTIDPDYTPPSNLRNKPWSPEPQESAVSPRQKTGRQVSNASNRSEGGGVRRGSVPDRSPLQNLETWSKEEKRARVERAERKMSGGKRVVSDPLEGERKENVSNQRNVSGPGSLGYRKEVGSGSGQKPNQAKAYQRTPDVQQQQQQQPQRLSTARASMDSADVERTASAKYKRRNRDSGFAGAAEAAAAAPSVAAYDAAADRGKAAYERRKSQQASEDGPRDSIGRSGSKATQRSGEDAAYAGPEKNAFPPKEQLKTAKNNPINYNVPPQTAAAHQAREQIGFDNEKPNQYHRFGGIFHREGHGHRSYQPSEKPMEDWRQGKIGRLTEEDLDLEAAVRAAQKPQKPADAEKDAAWWEKDQRSRRVSGSANAKPSPRANIPQFDGPYEEQANGFQPRLFLKCGPLLRYTGMRREAGRNGGDKETWRGSVMIVTEDDHSDLSAAPILRMFRQDMDLHQPPPRHLVESGNVPAEHEDPIAGQVKLSRTGRALYVRPVHDIDGEVDLSGEENNQGLYSATRTSLLGPQGNPANPAVRPHITFQHKSRIKARDGEKLGRYREVKGTRLHCERSHTFWRFNLEIELASVQTRVAYRINKGPAVSFWVPARGETMNVMFHSCNGFSLSVDSNTFSGPDPLWRDVLNRHQAKPFHVMLGGGDQIYNDALTSDTVLFKEWLAIKNSMTKHSADFTVEIQDELETFYLERYAMWFSQGLFGMAAGQVPMVNIWDDHDIIDGFGSYPHHFQASPVFAGLGAIAYKYYMLFQHQSLPSETSKDEPSWLLGQSAGPYINQVSRSIFLSLGKKMAFLGLDCRTERMRDEILSQETYDIIFDRCRREIIKGETKHLIVLLGVPIAYPRLNFLENVLTSRVMDPIKALGRRGMLGGFVNKFDGGVEILDDLDDHWTAKHHKAERNWFIQELQEIAAEKSVRITILGGDVHLAAIGRFYTKKDLGVPKDKDHRYMPNIVSSAIVNTPPPSVMADVLNRRNRVHHLDAETDEDMVRIFETDVDGSKRNNNCMLPRRNFCILGEYVPGSTPPGTPDGLNTPMSATFPPQAEDGTGKDRRFPPGSMKRTMSLTRGPAALVRRLSGSSKRRPSISRPSMDSQQGRPQFDGIQRANSLGSHPPDGYNFPPRHQPAPPQTQIERRPSYHRRPTDLDEKAARKAAERIGQEGNLDGRAPGEISLEGGLDVCLCVERDQKDPGGSTVGYRLLVPALWYEGEPDRNLARFSSHRKSLMERLRGNRKREEVAVHDQEDDEDDFGHAGQEQQEPRWLEGARAYAQQRPNSQQYSQQPQSQPQAQQFSQQPQAEQHFSQQQQRGSRDVSGNSSAANSLGLTSTGRGAVTALPNRSSSGNGYSENTAALPPTRSASSKFPSRPRASMDMSEPTTALPPTRSASSKIPASRPRASMDTGRPLHDEDAFAKGFSGSGPPIGGQFSAAPVARGPGAGVYPPSGYRRVSSGGQQQQQQSHHVLPPQDATNMRNGGPTRRNTGGGLPLSSVMRDGEEDDGYSSFDSEEEEAEHMRQQEKGRERRGSKAERFFGIGGGEGENAGGDGGKREKKGWMIWK